MKIHQIEIPSDMYPNACNPPTNSCFENSHMVAAFMCHETTNCRKWEQKNNYQGRKVVQPCQYLCWDGPLAPSFFVLMRNFLCLLKKCFPTMSLINLDK